MSKPVAIRHHMTRMTKFSGWFHAATRLRSVVGSNPTGGTESSGLWDGGTARPLLLLLERAPRRSTSPTFSQGRRCQPTLAHDRRSDELLSPDGAEERVRQGLGDEIGRPRQHTKSGGEVDHRARPSPPRIRPRLRRVSQSRRPCEGGSSWSTRACPGACPPR